MHSVHTEVAEEILMLFQHRNRHTLARQKIAQHDAGGTAAYNATGRLQHAFGHTMTFLSKCQSLREGISMDIGHEFYRLPSPLGNQEARRGRQPRVEFIRAPWIVE